MGCILGAVRYLRLLFNCLLAGALAGVYLALLVYHLNPSTAFTWHDGARVALAFAVSHGAHLAALFYALLVVRQLISSQIFSPGWISFRVLTWLSMIVAAAVAPLAWANLMVFRDTLDGEAARRFGSLAITMTVVALGCFTLGLVRYSFGRRGGPAVPFLLLLLVAAPLTTIVNLQMGPAPLESSYVLPAINRIVPASATRRVTIIGIDGATLDYILPAVADGRLPNFGTIIERGATARLITVRPAEPAPIWTTIATGKYPFKHGIRAGVRYTVGGASSAFDLLPDYCFSHALVRFGLAQPTERGRAGRSARPIWAILSDLGISVGVVRWPATTPVEPVQGYMVADAFFRDRGRGGEETELVYPPDLWLRLEADVVDPDHVDAATLAEYVRTDRTVPDDRFDWRSPLRDAALAADGSIERMAADLAGSSRPQFSATYYFGLDPLTHYFLRYADPEEFGDVTEAERRKYGKALDRYYEYLDRVVGSAASELRGDDLLLVVSGYGTEPLSLPKRVMEYFIGNRYLSGTHENAPDGLLLAYGVEVRRGGRMGRLSVLDVAPTLLYYMGLPIGRDMDGTAVTGFFQDAFARMHPVSFVPTYERAPARVVSTNP